MPKKTKPLNIAPEDMDAALQLMEALEQVEDLPLEDQWPMALELLPDSVLLHTMQALNRKDEMEKMNLFGTLAVVLIREFLDLEPEPPLIMLAMGSIMVSFLGELEKRRKVFCMDVIHMASPFKFDQDEPVKFIPKDPESFNMDAVWDYYKNLNE